MNYDKLIPHGLDKLSTKEADIAMLRMILAAISMLGQRTRSGVSSPSSVAETAFRDADAMLQEAARDPEKSR